MDTNKDFKSGRFVARCMGTLRTSMIRLRRTVCSLRDELEARLAYVACGLALLEIRALLQRDLTLAKAIIPNHACKLHAVQRGTCCAKSDTVLMLTADDQHTPAPQTQDKKRSKLILPPDPVNTASNQPAPLQTLPSKPAAAKPDSKLLPLPPLTPSTEAKIVFQPSTRSRRVTKYRTSRTTKSWLSGTYLNFYCKCPSCQSEEVYAMKADGRFATSQRDLSWLIQRMFCERCTRIYKRPGRLIPGPRPSIRPEDRELYGD